MTEPATDDVDFDSGLEEVNGGGVPEEVRAHASPGPAVIEVAGVAPHHLVNPEPGERSAVGGEHRGFRTQRLVRRDQLFEQFRGLPPQRAGSPFVSLAVQPHDRVLTELEVPGSKVGDLLRRAPVL